MNTQSSPLNPTLDGSSQESWDEQLWKRANPTFHKEPLKAFPLRHYLAKYSWTDARADIKAGLNVAMLDFPQGMAYALIAGLPFTMGVFASAVAALLGPFLASSRFIMLGPTNAIAVLTLSTSLGLGFTQIELLSAMPLLLILVGVFMFVGGICRVANVINYISRTVVIGYIHAAALLIIAKQLENTLGLTLSPSSSFIHATLNTLANIRETQFSSIALSLTTIAIALLIRAKVKRIPEVASTLVIMTIASIAAERWLGWSIPKMGEGVASQNPLNLDFFHWNGSLVLDLVQPAFAIAFLSLLESSSIAKTLAAKSGESVNINQQMLSMGVANLGCSLFSGMPISGSLTRSVLNERSGARTPVSSIFSSLILFAGMAFMFPYLSLIPLPALSALVILVGISLIDPISLRFALRSTGSDTIVFISTFATGLILGLDTAIYVGVCTSIILFMRKAGLPTLSEIAFDASGHEKAKGSNQPGLAMLHVDGDLFFASSDLFLQQARKLTCDPNLRIIVLRLRNARNLDATCAIAISQLVSFARSRGRELIISGAHPEVLSILRKSGLLQTIGPKNVFMEDPENPTRSNSESLKRAREIVGKDLDVRLFLAEKDQSGTFTKQASNG